MQVRETEVDCTEAGAVAEVQFIAPYRPSLDEAATELPGLSL